MLKAIVSCCAWATPQPPRVSPTGTSSRKLFWLRSQVINIFTFKAENSKFKNSLAKFPWNDAILV